MEETAAREWVEQKFDVPRETMQRIHNFAELLRQENQRQNLVSTATLNIIWTRHIVDSAQLLLLGSRSGDWLDLGAGSGFPGLILAALGAHVTLVEQRRLRAEFLQKAAEILAVEGRCEIICSRIERVEARTFRYITARAFAPLPELLDLALPFSTEETRWILPKGRKAETELEAARPSWQGDFRLEPSVTDPDARIIVAQKVRRRSKETRRA